MLALYQMGAFKHSIQFMEKHLKPCYMSNQNLLSIVCLFKSEILPPYWKQEFITGYNFLIIE